ncbi:sigma-70 family RNA polymerase sigma factor [bacterium]|nr:sigma-70 family RNA polymerase sigma factor [bacterium]
MVKGFFKKEPAEKLSDEELVRKAASGSKECWRELVGRYSKMISSTVWKITGGREADDVIQEVLVQLFQSLGTFRSESSFSTFLYRLTVNTACNEVKRMTSPAQAVPVADDALTQLADDANDSDDSVFDDLERGEIRRKVGEALAELPAEIRAYLVLFYVEELTLKQISELFKTPVTTVASRIGKGKALLTERLGKLR